MKVAMPSRLRDSMYNLHPKSGSSVEYAKGVLVGAVSALMSTGVDFQEALAACRDCFPTDIRMECVPESWINNL